MTEGTQAYPLHWPLGWTRTPALQRERARFSQQVRRSFAAVRDDLLNELRLLGADMSSVVLSTNIPIRRDGLPYATFKAPEDTGVAVYFTLRGTPKCFPCDKWDRIEDNLRAISLTINALRGLERWGAREMVDAVFQGFDALPATVAGEGWWDVLGVDRLAELDEVTRAYRARLREAHPDTGGSTEAFHRVQEAWAQFVGERMPR